jgi:hypothetical protein
MQYQLCLPWYWEYDNDFVQMVERACLAQDVTLWQITPGNLLKSITALYKGETTFKTILDRSQEDIRFDPIHRWARDQHVRRINPAELSAWSEDKTTMHLEFIHAGLQTPYTIMFPPFIEQPVLPQFDLSPLGKYFVIKPSNGGGGEGVILGASSIDQILRARLEFPEQKYLAQAHVTPCVIENRKAWFRSFYAAGEIYPCWWDPDTHIYAILSEQDETSHDLVELKKITKRIAAICKLDWFSTEIALTEDHFVVVDYVNDGIDLRLQSKAMDGVPDEIVDKIAGQLVELAKKIYINASM